MCSNTGENSKVRFVCVRNFSKSVYNYPEQYILRVKPSRGVINVVEVEARIFRLETCSFSFKYVYVNNIVLKAFYISSFLLSTAQF